ncbi:uncharacterized protein A4U43_UnF2430 [Asparagus officinalis]|uniref:Uncharacterized protein n=2 Tax=Asparagus officinalis TaxID=4686 RepID=A0A1R3L7B1_ASPOF|nr:uncharacterized protein A4U43_UnF2430 [Asparagus officinalis]
MEGKVEAVVVDEKESMHLMKEGNLENPHSDEMEIDDNGISENTNETIESMAPEKGEGSNVVFSRESPLLTKEPQVPKCHKGKKPRSRASDSTEEECETRRKVKDKSKQEMRLTRQERIELGQLFQEAVSSHDWEHAEGLIMLADMQTLNDGLCIALDSIWFLSNRQEVNGITCLIRKIVSYGAHDFTRAVLRTSFLASCVSACRSKTMSLEDTVNFMAQR